jgi:CDGSH iron-sulfur domain-containing protein 3
MNKVITQFRVIQNGPLEVTGDFIMKDDEGKAIAVKSPVYLCRCGASGNKPFCNGAHKKNGFCK